MNMSNTILLLGGSGCGKSTSLRNLNPKETFIISVLGKRLPFRGAASKYTPIKGWDDKENNLFISDDCARVTRCIQHVNHRSDIKVLVIDDFNYLLVNQFMKRAQEKGYDKFTEMAKNIHGVVECMAEARSDLFCVFTMHNELDATGFSKIKTVGKMLEEKVSLEGMVSATFHAMVVDGEFKFLTQRTETHLARSPMDLFKDKYIDNDLNMIINTMRDYFNEDVPL
jgi:hypothetical protein